MTSCVATRSGARQTRRGAATTAARAIGAAAALAALPAACSAGRQPGTAGGGTGQLKAGTRLTVIAWGGPPAVEVRTRLLEQFAQKYPGVSGEYSQPGAYWDKLQAMLAGGTPPDVFFMNPYFFKLYVVRGSLLNLSPLVKRDRVDLSDFYPVARGLFTHRNDLWGMPLHFNGINLAFNRAAFDAAGVKYPSQDLKRLQRRESPVWDFDAFLDAGRRLTKTEGGQATQWGTSINTSFQWYLSFVYANGGDLVNKDQTVCTLAEPPAVEALQYLQDLVHKYRVAAIPATLSPRGLNLLTAFTSGRTAMYWPSGAPQFGQIRPAAQFPWDVGILPVGKGKPATGMGAPGYTVARDTRTPDEAWVLADLLTNKEAQLAEVQAGVITPSRRSVAFSPEFLNQRPPEHVRVVSETLDIIKLPLQVATWQDIQTALGQEMAPLWTGEKTAREAAAAAKRAIDPYLQQAKALEGR